MIRSEWKSSVLMMIEHAPCGPGHHRLLGRRIGQKRLEDRCEVDGRLLLLGINAPQSLVGKFHSLQSRAISVHPCQRIAQTPLHLVGWGMRRPHLGVMVGLHDHLEDLAYAHLEENVVEFLMAGQGPVKKTDWGLLHDDKR